MIVNYTHINNIVKKYINLQDLFNNIFSNPISLMIFQST